MSDPILIIGCSRSGTSLVARLLTANGVFLGADLESNHESKSMQALNRWVLANAGAGLETPERVDVLLADAFARAAVAQTVETIVTQHRWRFWRWRAWSPPDRWGFKDPRTTFTLPVWLDVFPRARVLHVLRHGVDVAMSLRERRHQVERRWRAGQVPRADDLVRQHRVVANLAVDDLGEGLAHWQRYVRRASAHVAALGDRAHELRYEDLFVRRGPALRDLGAWLDHRIVGDRIVWREQRARGFRWSLEGQVVAHEHRALLGAWGYSDAA